MTFKDLAEYFDKLEKTSSRLILIDILAELFKETKKEEIAMISYLIQSRVAPFYEAIEMGMSEKLVAASIARAFGVDKGEVLKEYGKVGDLGVVAERLSDAKRHPEFISGSIKKMPKQVRHDSLSVKQVRHDSLSVKQVRHDSLSVKQVRHDNLSVKEVFETLTEIANTKGDGTVEKKVVLLSGLLSKVDGVGAKHLVRIPLGSNRLGIGDPTILDGFALSKLGDRSKRKLLEGAYNKTSDLGLIGETLFEKGLEGVLKLDVTVGRPIRSQLAERLPDPKTILEKFEGKAHVQQKFDGFRVQIHLDRSQRAGSKVRLFSRNLEETTLMFPDIIKGVLQQVSADSIILDSEALAFNPESEEFLPFQETTKRRRKYDIEEMSVKLPLKAFVFDIMYLNGKSLMEESLESRIKSLEKAVQGDEVLIPQIGEITNSPERIQEIFDDALTKGLEGLIVKRPTSKYEAGARNFNWVKLKRHSSGELQDTIDCVILGYIFGKGKRAAFGAGALLVGVYDKLKDEFVTVSKIGTGLTDEEWKEIHKRADKIKVAHKPARVNSKITPSVWVEPKIVIEVLADEVTRSPLHTAGVDSPAGEPGYALRFPRLVKFREEDKQAEDSTTVKELIEMFELQYKK